MERKNKLRLLLLALAGALGAGAIALATKGSKEDNELDLSSSMDKIDTNTTTIDDLIYSEEITVRYNINGEKINTKRTLANAAEELEENIKVYQLLRKMNFDSSILTKQKTEEIDYEVKSGDTLSEIALRYNTFVDKIKTDNKLKSDDIKVGQVLIIKPNINIPNINTISTNVIKILEEYLNDETKPERRIELANILNEIKKSNNYYFEQNSKNIIIYLGMGVVKCSVLDGLDLSIESYSKVTIPKESKDEPTKVKIENYDVDEKGKAVSANISPEGLIGNVVSIVYRSQQDNRVTIEVTDEFVEDITNDLSTIYKTIEAEKQLKSYGIFGKSVTAKGK